MTHNELFELALDAINDLEGEINGYRAGDFPISEKAKVFLRQAITTEESSATQEPAAWLQVGVGPLHEGDVIARTTKPKEWNPEWWRFEPLYTHPQPKADHIPDATKMVEQESVLACTVVDVDYSCDTAVVLIQDTRDYEFNNGQYWLTNVKPQPKAEQEPVAYQDTAKPDELVSAEDWDNIDPMYKSFYQPLYTHPQPKAEQEPKREWVGLTDEECREIREEANLSFQPEEIRQKIVQELVEAKLKEKNTQSPIKWSDYESDGRIIKSYPEKDKT